MERARLFLNGEQRFRTPFLTGKMTAQEILGYLGAIQFLYSRTTGYTTADVSFPFGR